MARSPVRRGRPGRKKAVDVQESVSSSKADNFPAPKQGQGQVKSGGDGNLCGTESGDDELIRESVSVFMEKASKPKVESSGKKKSVQKLDDQAYKAFGSRSRASSDAGSCSDATFCIGGPGKSDCGEPVRSSDDGVLCEKCSHWFHIGCQGIPKPAYEALKKYKVLSWFCNECRGVVRKDDSRLVSLESKVDQLDKAVKEQLGKMVHCLREQERAVDGQTKLIERSIRENVAQKSTYADMVKGSCSEVVNQVSAKLSNLPQLTAERTTTKDVQNISRVFDDFLDKDRRKNNLVVHNLPEAEAASLAERSKQDISQFQEIVKDVFRLQVKASKSFRVGKAVPDGHRLLIVTLEGSDMKHDILQLAPQLRNSQWENIYITPDLTKSERELARKLRQELRSRRSAGEENIFIKKGKIVSSLGRQVDAAHAANGGGRQVVPEARKVGSVTAGAGGADGNSSTSALQNTGSAPASAVGNAGDVDIPSGHSRAKDNGPNEAPSKRQA